MQLQWHKLVYTSMIPRQMLQKSYFYHQKTSRSLQGCVTMEAIRRKPLSCGYYARHPDSTAFIKGDKT